MFRKILGGILIYSFLVYSIVVFGPTYELYALQIDPPTSLQQTPLFLLLGGVFWLIYDVIRYILKIVTLPLNWMTFGVTHTLLNVGMIYLFVEVINKLGIGVLLTTGSFFEVLIMAVLLGIIGLFIKYL